MVPHVAMHVEVHVQVPALHLSLYFRSYQFKLPVCNSTISVNSPRKCTNTTWKRFGYQGDIRRMTMRGRMIMRFLASSN